MPLKFRNKWLLLAVTVCLLAVVGWFVWQSQQKTAAEPPVTDGSYSNWKEYCDTTINACFKYPAHWTLRTEKVDDIALAIAADPEETVEISYAVFEASEEEGVPIDGEDGLPFFTTATSATKDNGFKVVSGYYTSEESPLLQIVKNDSPLSDNTVSTIPPETLLKDNKRGYFIAREATGSNIGADKAKEWFSSEAATLSLLTLQSFKLR